MRILFFSRLFYPHIGGVEKHVLEISKELIKKGHTIIVVTEKLENLPEQELYENIQIYRIPINKKANKKIVIWRWLWQHKDLIKQADIIHCHDVFFWVLPFRFLFPHKKIFTTFHGYETVCPPAKKALRMRWISEKLSRGNICVGEFIQKWYGTKPTFVTFGGVNKNKNLTAKEITTPLEIIMIGRLDKDTGAGIYERTIKIIKNKKLLVNISVYGDGKYKKQFNIMKIWKGMATDIGAVISKSDIVFASSYLSMLEALSQEKIVIAVYDNPLKEDYLKMSPFANFILLCKNETEIFTAVQSVVDNPGKYETMKKNGGIWARKQTWKSVAEIYLSLWKK